MTDYRIYNTGDAASRFTSGIVFGAAGCGKTPIAATLPSVCVLATERGLSSLASARLPVMFIDSKQDALNVFDWIRRSNEAKKFQSFYLDGISGISETIFHEERRKSSDFRKISPNTTIAVMEIVKAFLEIEGRHCWMSCKAVNTPDSITGAPFWDTHTIVKALSEALPYHFDNILMLTRLIDSATGNVSAWLTTGPDGTCRARNRLGALNLYEPPDLGAIIQKIAAHIAAQPR